MRLVRRATSDLRVLIVVLTGIVRGKAAEKACWLALRAGLKDGVIGRAEIAAQNGAQRNKLCSAAVYVLEPERSLTKI